MAIPFIEAVTPGRGHSGGGTLVQIDGHNFRVPVAVAPGNQPAPPPPPTVEVLFDGLPARAVKVISENVIRCLTPRHPPDRVVDGVQVSFGTVDVVVRNLADDGTVIAGETATLAAMYSFVRPELMPYKGAWARTLYALKTMFQELLLENVAVNPSVDYDRDTLEPLGFVELADSPGIALTAITFPPSPDEGPEEQEVDVDGEYVLIRRAPIVTDISGTMVLVATDQTELVNLTEQTTHIFRDFGLLVLPIDPLDASHGELRYRLELGTQGFQLSTRFGNSDLQTSEAPWRLRGVLSSDMPGAPLEGVPQSPKWFGHHGTIGVTRKAKSIVATPRRKG